ncbi:hypothetical protein FRX31_004228 [Thalictrum thalictroides]|uniref:Uncharacterized protein n=1 Tax=Thalictrum thalictroides TaxID=46969 RepID=A0A7J6XBH4_THATH|nr:hypothetical protein FRX31_004228 [Thalictrum thalictroides]
MEQECRIIPACGSNRFLSSVDLDHLDVRFAMKEYKKKGPALMIVTVTWLCNIIWIKLAKLPPT